MYVLFFSSVLKTLGCRFGKTLNELRSTLLRVPSPEEATEHSHQPGPGAGGIPGTIRQMDSFHEEPEMRQRGMRAEARREVFPGSGGLPQVLFSLMKLNKLTFYES